MTTTKYGLHEIEYSVAGWDTIMNSDMQKLDEVIHTNITVTLGETVAQYEAVGIFSGETKYKKAKSGGNLQPALGLALAAGILDDEINIQRVGPITNASWSWTVGKPVFLSPSVAGGLTQAPSGTTQLMGIAHSATTIILNGAYNYSSLPSTTSTSTTTTSNTQSSTSSTTSSSSSTTTTTS